MSENSVKTMIAPGDFDVGIADSGLDDPQQSLAWEQNRRR
jgi:hypothetical protein